MFVGYIVGIIVAVVLIIGGCVAVANAKRNNRKNKWGFVAIVFGVTALISAAVNYNLFGG
jgi:glycerol uptake facilitator-like aquaporin